MGEDGRNRGWLRRRSLLATGVVGMGSLAVGCDALSTTPEGQRDGDGGGDPDAKEAPTLADRVADGDLPPLEERLPSNPLVVEPHDQVGRYGGELRSVILDAAQAVELHRIVGYEPLVRWTPDWAEEVIPNIAEDFQVNADGTMFTFTLRAGMKWSDGEAFTADDVVFAQNDVLNHPDLSPGEDTNPVRAEKVDRYTVRFIFDEPDGLFLQQLATPAGNMPLALVTKPRHYLEQFHADYNSDVDSLVREAGLSDWVELFPPPSRLEWDDADIPTLNPWILVNAVGDGSSQVVLERNPFYFKTDPDGRQLPYIDRVTYDMISREETILLRTQAGEVDLNVLQVNTLANKPVLAEAREEGDYDFFDMIPSNMNTMALCLNLCHHDDVLRDIFREKDFRIGLSHAINRQEIIDTVYQKQGEPWQCGPRPESDLYDEELAKQYTAHDPDLAKSHLDRVVPETDGDGYRLRPDGERLSFSVEFPRGLWAEYPDVLELVEQYWDEVGVEINVRGLDRSLYDERKNAGEHDANVWQGAGGLGTIYMWPNMYFPSAEGNAAYAYSWTQWYLTDGAEGEEPPEPMKQQMELYDTIKQTTDRDEQAAAMTNILRIAREQFWVMGINLQPDEYGIVSNRLRNVPGSMPHAWEYPTPAPTNPEQYYIA